MKKLFILLSLIVLLGCPVPDKAPHDKTAQVQQPVSATEENVHATPEPATLILLGAGLVGIGLYGRSRKK